jgi:hypothetical protein
MLSSAGILISICEDPGRCPIFQGQWHVQKTTPHHDRTISHGQFEIRETIHVCANRCRLDSGQLVTRMPLPSFVRARSCTGDSSIAAGFLKVVKAFMNSARQIINPKISDCFFIMEFIFFVF